MSTAQTFKFLTKCPCCHEEIEVYLSKKSIKLMARGFKVPVAQANKNYGKIKEGIYVRRKPKKDAEKTPQV